MVKREIHPTRENRLTKEQKAKVKRNARLFYRDLGITERSPMEGLYRALGTSNPAVAMIRMIALYNRQAQEEQAQHERAMMQRARNRREERAFLGGFQFEPPPTRPDRHQYTFIIYLTLRIEYKKSWYEPLENKRYKEGEVKIIETSTSPTTDFKRNIPDIVKQYNIEESGKITTVISHRVVYMNTIALTQNRKPKIKQRMRRAFVMSNNWLRYSRGIGKTAYDNAEGKCVYHQLTDYLTNPPSNKPSNFIYYTNSKKQHVSEESLYRFFCEKIQEGNLQEDYPDFTIESGVSTELIGLLCKSLKRNLYALDEDEKIFYAEDSSDSKNYCPIVFYKFNDHCWIINNKSMISSTAEINKNIGNRVISITLEEKPPEINNLPVYHIDKYDVSNSKNMEEGIYIVNQSHLDKEIIEFMQIFKETPKIKSTKSLIMEIKFKVGLINNDSKKYVIICIDTTHAEDFTHQQLKNVAVNSNINYVNENIGSVILSILDNANKPECKEKTVQDKLAETTKPKDNEASVFNTVVLDNIVENKAWNSYQFVENVPYVINTKLTEYKIDTIKCRRNILLHSTYEFPVYCVMDIPKDFTTIEGIIKCGLYYIETYNIFPFRGCGWYSHPIVEYGLKHNLITLGEIKLEFIPSYTLPANHFIKHINIIMNAFKVEPPIQKKSINSLIGLFGKTKRTSSKVKYTQSIEEASLWWGEKDPKMNVFIENIKLDNDEVIYKGIFTENVEVEGMKYPIYKQVLEMEALQLHTLENIIINKKGVILDRNTDAIRYARKEPINISDYFWNDEKTVLKYHNEVVKPLKCEVLPRMCRKHQLDYNIFNLQWNIQYDYDGTAQEEAKRIIDTNQSIHINGRAGTGKTYLVNKVIDELKARGKICKGFSPTNKGARLIGGNTIHSLYFKFKSNKKGLFRMIEKEKLEYIFIDEVSMMIKDFYQLFILIKRAFNNIKFIIAGDYGQLPPVKDNWSGDYENSPAMFNLCDGNKINLTTCRRADNELYNLCYDVNSIDIKRFKPTEKTYLNIAYTHRTRININRECMERYLSNNVNQSVSIPKDKENPKTQDVYLTKGMPIIAHKTDKNKNILNSQTFTITNITNEIIKYKDDKTEYSLSVNEFHKYFYLGFCITIHASQGETFNTKYTIYDWEITPFCNKAKYVAMSRSTDINNIQIAQE